MRNKSKVLPASLALVLSSPLLAAPPVPFGNYSQGSGGRIISACPNGYQCFESVNDQGVFQRLLVDTRSGRQYIQSIINDTDANGTMNLESFIQANNGPDDAGISAKQRVRTSGSTTLDSQVTLNTGWANTGNGPAFVVDQSVGSTQISGLGYQDNFHHEVQRDSQGRDTGFYQRIRQAVTNSHLVGGDAGLSPTGQDRHVFESRRAQGSYVSSSGSVSLPSSAGGMSGMMDSSGPTGGTMSWRAGDEVQAIWIGQVCEGCQISGGMMAMGGGGGTTGGTTGGGGGGGGMGMAVGNGMFMYQAFDNLSDSNGAVATRDLGSTSPVNWNNVFGAQPQF